MLGPLNSLVWWEVPLVYIALGSFFVSARTNKRHHHQRAARRWRQTSRGSLRFWTHIWNMELWRLKRVWSSSCESVTQVRSRKAHLRCATDAREANGAQLLRSAPSACGLSAIALLLNLENSPFRTNSNNLRRIESCPLNINLRCPNFTHSLMIHPSYK
jgi:hypothetical protein